jgi:hypothetical protein
MDFREFTLHVLGWIDSSLGTPEPPTDRIEEGFRFLHVREVAALLEDDQLRVFGMLSRMIFACEGGQMNSARPTTISVGAEISPAALWRIIIPDDMGIPSS